MKKLNESIFINASQEKVWDTMLSDQTYRTWTKVFNPNSHYEGNWEEGSKMIFLGSDSEGKGLGGMVARIKENRPHEFLSIEHIGMIENGIEDTTSERVKAWAPAYENYTFNEKDGGTELVIEMDIEDQYEEMFKDMWPKALLALKELAEGS